MRRLVSLLTLGGVAIMLVALLAIPLAVFAQDGHGDDAPGETEGGAEGDAHTDEFAPLRGAAVYAEFCQACHGPQGEARGTGAAFPAINYDAGAAHEAIVNGADSAAADGVAMPGYGAVLSEAQIDDVLAYMATWESGETPALPEPNVHVEETLVPDYFGDAQAGAEVYAKFCAGCHGPAGQGRTGDAFPALAFDALTTRRIAAQGAESPYMPGFAASVGGPLSDEQLTDLETYLASWAQADDTESDEGADKGVAVMIVILGVVAILTVGVAYLARAVPESRDTGQIV